MPDNWLPVLSRASGTKYLAIADALETAIVRGVLRHGDRIQPQREVAARLSVDLTTVTKAYDVARSRGLIASRGRAGSFVLPQGKRAPDLSQFDTGVNMPPELPDDLLARAMSDCSAHLLATDSHNILHYQPAGGAPKDREAGAAYLSALGLASDPDQVILASGGQNALHAILSALLQPGDSIACGRFVYSGMKAVAARLGLHLVALDTMSSDALAALCERAPVKALYIVPTNDNPTTHTISLQERMALAETARRFDLQVIEDDAYGPLALERLPTIASLAPERSWHVASFSKLITPALRVAYVRAPDVAGAFRLATDVHETAVMAPPLNTAILTAWLANRTYPRLLEAMRRETMARNALAASILGESANLRHPQGYHLWIPLRDTQDGAAIAAAARSTRLSIVPSERFAVGRQSTEAIRISLGGLIDRDNLARGLHIVKGLLSAPSGRSLPIV